MKKIIASFYFVVFLGLVFIPLVSQVNACEANGNSCSLNSDCCSNYCSNKSCAKEPPPMTPQCEHFEKGFFGGGICEKVYSPIGPISTQPGEFIKKIFLFLLPAAGSIAVLLIMRSGYRLITSRGDPESIKEGREQLVAAIVGLMFIIFSFVILQIITKDLLNIPGF